MKEKISTPEDAPLEDGQDLKALVEKSIRWSQVLHEQNKKILRRMTWMAVGSYIRLALFLIPLIVGIIFLPPLLKQAFGQYQSLFDDIGGSPFSALNQFLPTDDDGSASAPVSKEQIIDLLKSIQKE